MSKCTAASMAQEGLTRGRQKIPYSKEDCQAFVEKCLAAAGGGSHNWSGSNHMFRNALTYHNMIDREPPIGAWVFKARGPEAAGYNLPSRYKKGGDRYNGDLLDYYHVGIYCGNGQVAHSTTADGIDGARVDTTLPKWQYYGLCKYVAYDAEGPVTDDNTDSDAIARAFDYLARGYEYLAKAKEILERMTNGNG